MRFAFVSALAGAILSPVPAPAQSVVAGCAPGAPALAAELVAWCVPTPVIAAADSNDLPAAKIEIGRAYAATLKSTTDVHYITRPEKPGDSLSFGGLLSFEVVQAGTYRVALSSGAWIDLLQDGKAVISTSHGHGPDGSGIRKMVDFPLSAGRHTLQLAANGEALLTLMVARLP